jgi:hypothetical protein
VFDRSRNKALGTPADASGEARAFAGPGAANAGGFGRRKTPIPATTDGAAPASVANDSAAVGAALTTGATTGATTGMTEGSASADSGGAAHPFFNDRAAGAPEETRPTYEGPLSVTDDRADDLIAWLSDELREGRRVELESVLCALGALAGYAAQQAIRETMVKSGRLTLDQAFVVIETRSGEWFFFGDLLNAVLGAQEGSAAGSRNSSRHTIWRIISDAGHQAGAISLPDITDIVKHCAATVGTVDFGLPRLPDVHMPAVLPREAVSRFWQPTLRRLNGAGPMSWPLHLAMAAHKLIIDMKDTIRPDIAVRIVMEAAVPMSKIDPVTVPKE